MLTILWQNASFVDEWIQFWVILSLKKTLVAELSGRVPCRVWVEP